MDDESGDGWGEIELDDFVRANPAVMTAEDMTKPANQAANGK